jgi:hypothetical protein
MRNRLLCDVFDVHVLCSISVGNDARPNAILDLSRTRGNYIANYTCRFVSQPKRRAVVGSLRLHILNSNNNNDKGKFAIIETYFYHYYIQARFQEGVMEVMTPPPEILGPSCLFKN